MDSQQHTALRSDLNGGTAQLTSPKSTCPLPHSGTCTEHHGRATGRRFTSGEGVPSTAAAGMAHATRATRTHLAVGATGGGLVARFAQVGLHHGVAARFDLSPTPSTPRSGTDTTATVRCATEALT